MVGYVRRRGACIVCPPGKENNTGTDVVLSSAWVLVERSRDACRFSVGSVETAASKWAPSPTRPVTQMFVGIHLSPCHIQKLTGVRLHVHTCNDCTCDCKYIPHPPLPSKHTFSTNCPPEVIVHMHSWQNGQRQHWAAGF